MSSFSPITQHTAFRLSLTAMTGVFGSFVFLYLSLPLPWLLGALCATMAASLVGAPVEIKPGFRRYLIVVLGVMLGGTFTPEVIERVDEWIPTLVAAVGYLVVITFVAQLYCRKVIGMDPVTAIFSGTPGGLSEMIILGEENGADVRTLTLTHAVRVASVLLAIPFFLTYWVGVEGVEERVLGEIWSAKDAVILLIVAVSGVVIGKLGHFPVYHLTGPMMLSAIVHLTGGIAGDPPHVVSVVVQVAMGCALGARFFGVAFRDVGRILVLAMGLGVAMMSVTLLSAFVLSTLTNASFEALVLALSPGGFAEIALAALSMNIDPAFVTTHHGLRLLIVVFIAPMVLSYWAKRISASGHERS